MKEKGFTLIELLAVIVILAIIALIATPIVLNIIEDSKKSSKLRSANHYVDAVEQSIMKYNMNNGGNFIPSLCEVQQDGNLKCDGKDIVVEVDGEKPISGAIKFELGKVTKVGLNYGDKYIGNNEDGNLVSSYKTYYENGDVVYYNVSTGKICSKSEAVNTTGTKSGCMKFYAFNDDISSETVNLLLDHNTTAVVAWNSSSSNKSGPTNALSVLYNDTKDWVGTITPGNYTMDQSTQASGAEYEIKYNQNVNPGPSIPFKARLIAAQEIAQITGVDIALNWDEAVASNSEYYFDTLKPQTSANTACKDNDEATKCVYGWLYDRTSTSCKTYGCLNNSDISTNGYWTVSSYADNSYYAWVVGCMGSMSKGVVAHPYSFGIRPVIEVLKSNLS